MSKNPAQNKHVTEIEEANVERGGGGYKYKRWVWWGILGEGGGHEAS